MSPCPRAEERATVSYRALAKARPTGGVNHAAFGQRGRVDRDFGKELSRMLADNPRTKARPRFSICRGSRTADFMAGMWPRKPHPRRSTACKFPLEPRKQPDSTELTPV